MTRPRSSASRAVPRALFALAAIASGCRARTEIVVVVDTDLAVPGEVDTVVVEASGPEAMAPVRAAGPLTGAARPQTVVLARAGTSLGPVTVNVIARRDGRDVMRTTAVTSFVEGQVTTLRLDLVASCTGAPGFCLPGETCDAQGCRDPRVPGESLPAWSGSAPALAESRAKLFLGGRFPIGVMVQPIESFASWIARGVNTVVGVPLDRDLGAWTRAANAAGLWMIRDPADDPRGDLTESRLLAWTTGELPDADAVSIAARVAAQTAALRAIDPDRPTMLNVSGVRVIETGDTCDGPGDGGDEGCYPRYLTPPDWLCAQNFPVARNRPDDLASTGRVLDRLREWTAAKPTFARIETSRINADGAQTRGIAPAELRGTIWNAILHGARGITYFPLSFSPSFEFDLTPAPVIAEMTAQNARIASLAPVLQGAIDPAGPSIEAPAHFDVGWRVTPRGTYYFVLYLPACANPAVDCPGTSASIVLRGTNGAARAEVHREGRIVTLTPDGAVTEHFDPYELHVYVVP